MYKHSDIDHGADGAGRSMPRIGAISRSTVRAAMRVLRQQHGIAEVDDAFAALQTASQQHNVKLRAVAAAVVAAAAHGDAKPNADKRISPPRLSYTARGGAVQPNRTNVVGDLMRAAIDATGADFGTVQVRDPVHGGLILEGHQGFERGFLDFFSYVDGAGSACGASLVQRRQVLVDDVESSPLLAELERRTVLDAGVGAMLSTPLLDAQGQVWGVVTTHYCCAHRSPDDAATRTVRKQAEECARWLSWYDTSVMPGVLATVHAEARRAVPSATTSQAADV